MTLGGWGGHGRVLHGLTGTSLDIAGGGQVTRHVTESVAISGGLQAYGAERVSAFLGGFAVPVGVQWNPRPGDRTGHRLKPFVGAGMIAVLRTSAAADDSARDTEGVGYGLGAQVALGADVHLTPRWAVGARIGYHAFPFTTQGEARDDFRGRQVALNVSWLASPGR
jgi:hypothetical protein